MVPAGKIHPTPIVTWQKFMSSTEQFKFLTPTSEQKAIFTGSYEKRSYNCENINFFSVDV